MSTRFKKGNIPWNTGKKFPPEQHYNWKGGQTTKQCLQCSKDFLSWPSQKTKFCSQACYNKSKPGRYKNKDGYVLVRSPQHPFASRGYVMEHRLVMEQHLGRYLSRKEFVHHINAVKHDNRLENLQLIAEAPHLGEVKCPHCEQKFVIH